MESNGWVMWKMGTWLMTHVQLFYMESETRGDAVIVWPSAFTSATWLYHIFIMSSVFIVDVSWMIKDLVRCYGISPSWFYNMYSTILCHHFYMESETTGDAVIVSPSAMLREYVIWMCWESTSTFCHHIAGLAFHSAGTWRCCDSTSTDMYCQLRCNACIDDGAVRASMFADWVLR